jgi:hypothetical protein
VTLLDIKGLDEMAVDMTRLVMVILQGEDTKIEESWHVQPALQKMEIGMSRQSPSSNLMTNGTKRKPWYIHQNAQLQCTQTHPTIYQSWSSMITNGLWTLDYEHLPAQGSQWPQCRD